MAGVRFDLEGKRLHVLRSDEVWLVVNGLRHLICSSAVYDRLFVGTDGLIAIEDVDHIARGDDLREGTCLINEVNKAEVYLLAPCSDGNVYRHYIATDESFKLYGFSESLIFPLPKIVVESIARGKDLPGLP